MTAAPRKASAWLRFFPVVAVALLTVLGGCVDVTTGTTPDDARRFAEARLREEGWSFASVTCIEGTAERTFECDVRLDDSEDGAMTVRASEDGRRFVVIDEKMPEGEDFELK